MSELIRSRTFRFSFVATLIAATVLVLVLTGVVLIRRCWPEWREHNIQQAMAQSGDVPFWWPSSWRIEYQQRRVQRELLRAAQAIEDIELQDLEKRSSALAHQQEQTAKDFEQFKKNKQREISDLREQIDRPTRAK